MNDDNFPDIEVYLLTNSVEDILVWLAGCFESMSPAKKAGNTLKLSGSIQKNTIPITITRQAAGKHFTSITFDSNKTTWATDLDCARSAFANLGVEVRCSADSWTESSEYSIESHWWRITEQGESRLSWQD